MFISYFDETGDDGYPEYSSEIFVLTSIYLYYQNWKDIYLKIYDFRKYLKEAYGFPTKLEFHTNKFMLNKKPFRIYGWDEKERIKIVKNFAEFISTLDMKSINVCIQKLKINSSNEKYYKNVLGASLNFNAQRIENDIKKIEPSSKFIIITDEGRVSSLRKTTRKIQKINFIPSKFGSTPYRQEINLLIEDPLPKNSKDSYFIQIADFISYFVYLYFIDRNNWHNRLKEWFDEKKLEEIINLLDPIFNKNASASNPHGFVCYPR